MVDGQGRPHHEPSCLRDPRRHRADAVRRYLDLAELYGETAYARIDAPADREQKARLAKLSASQVSASELAGEPITAILTEAPGNGAAIGGLKVTTENAWFAARPSGTEDVQDLCGVVRGRRAFAEVQSQAQELVDSVLGSAAD